MTDCLKTLAVTLNLHQHLVSNPSTITELSGDGWLFAGSTYHACTSGQSHHLDLHQAPSGTLKNYQQRQKGKSLSTVAHLDRLTSRSGTDSELIFNPAHFTQALSVDFTLVDLISNTNFLFPQSRPSGSPDVWWGSPQSITMLVEEETSMMNGHAEVKPDLHKTHSDSSSTIGGTSLRLTGTPGFLLPPSSIPKWGAKKTQPPPPLSL